MSEIWEAHPLLASERLVLRQLGAADRGPLFEIFSHPEVMRYWSSPPYRNHAQIDHLLRYDREGFEQRTALRWGIETREGHGLVGTCTLFAVDAGNRRAELGYILGRPHWGHGYVTEALTAVLDFAFGPFGLHRVEADVDPRNAASVRVLERLGFRREGLLRQRWIVAGEISDSAFYGLLEPEWTVRRNDASLRSSS